MRILIGRIMTVAELLEQAKTLSIQERREIVRPLEDSLGTSQPTTESKSGEHWGESLVRRLRNWVRLKWFILKLKIR